MDRATNLQTRRSREIAPISLTEVPLLQRLRNGLIPGLGGRRWEQGDQLAAVKCGGLDGWLPTVATLRTVLQVDFIEELPWN